MEDKEFLEWLHSRLENKHKENPNIDYMLRLKKLTQSYLDGDAGDSGEWTECEDSGQQRLDTLGGTFWLSEDVGDSYSLIKITVDSAGPNPSRPQRFATEKRAKDYVAFLQQQNYLEF